MKGGGRLSKLVKYETDEKIAHIILNKPEKLNSLCNEMVKELIFAFQCAEEDGNIHVIILSAEGKSFCAGGDIQTMQKLSGPYETMEWMKEATALMETMVKLDKFIVSAVHGYAAGAGFSIVLASDLVIADRNAKFALSFTNIGLIPDLGLMKLLAERIPLPLAKEWITSAAVISAEELEQRGLINQVTDGTVVEKAMEYCQFLVNGPPISNKYVKYFLNHVDSFHQDTALIQEGLIQTLLLQTEDHQEGVKAFYEKRPPAFKGK